jgi:hypothetical protein
MNYQDGIMVTPILARFSWGDRSFEKIFSTDAPFLPGDTYQKIWFRYRKLP